MSALLRTLALDASTYRGTVAVFVGDALVADAVTAMRGRDEERLMPAVAGALDAAGLRPADIDRVVCGAGPGSFTSLRIAASIAKGIGTARRVPLHAVPSLALIAAGDHRVPRGRYVATMDAMRGDRYAAVVEMGDGGAVRSVGAVELHPAADIARRAGALHASVLGADPETGVLPHAMGALRVLAAAGVDAAPVSLDDWEPRYGRLAEAQVRWEAAHGRPLPRE